MSEPEIPATEDAGKPLPLGMWDPTRPGTLDLAARDDSPRFSRASVAKYQDTSGQWRIVNSWGDGNHAPAIYGYARSHMHRLLFQVFNVEGADVTQVRKDGDRWLLRANRAQLSDGTIGELCRLAFAVDCEMQLAGVANLQAYINWWALCDRLRELCEHQSAERLEALLMVAQVPSRADDTRSAEYSIEITSTPQTRDAGDWVPSPFGPLFARHSAAPGEAVRCFPWVGVADTAKPGHGSVQLEPRVSDDGVVLVWKQEQQHDAS